MERLETGFHDRVELRALAISNLGHGEYHRSGHTGKVSADYDHLLKLSKPLLLIIV